MRVRDQRGVVLPSPLVMLSVIAVAMAAIRSLNEPVGLQPSSLKYNSGQPNSRPKRLDLTSGVSPSPMVIMGVALVIGSRSR